MISLLRIEFLRLRWRRAVLVILVAAMAVPLAVAGTVAWSTRPISNAEADIARAQVAEERKDPSYAQDLRACQRNPTSYGVPEELATKRCPQLTQPQISWYFDREPVSISEERGNSAVAVVVALMVALLLMGTTFAGHDWSTGSIVNQVIVEPRRRRIWVAKAVVVLISGLAVALTALLVFWTALWGVAANRGLAPTGSELTGAYASGMRGAVLAGGIGLLGYAITMLFRNTVATLGLVIAIAGVAPLLLTLGIFADSDQLLPQQNLLAVVLGGVVIDDFGDNCAGGIPTGDVQSTSCTTRITLAHGSAYYGVILIGAAAASLVAFGRRDLAGTASVSHPSRPVVRCRAGREGSTTGDDTGESPVATARTFLCFEQSPPPAGSALTKSVARDVSGADSAETHRRSEAGEGVLRRVGATPTPTQR